MQVKLLAIFFPHVLEGKLKIKESKDEEHYL
jgi:hypothetical protein